MVGDKKRLNFVLIFTGGYGFPVGDAYTNRILAFAKGFVKNNCTVNLLIIYPGRNNQAESRGSMDGFNYFFCAGLKRPKNWFARKIIGIKGIFNSVRIVIRLNRKEPIDAIMTFSQNYSQNFPLYLFTRLNKIVFIRENNEFPRVVIKRGHSSLTLPEKALFKFVNRFYDALEELSASNKLPIAKVHEYLRQKIDDGLPFRDLVQYDVVHPNDEGHRLMAEAILEVF